MPGFSFSLLAKLEVFEHKLGYDFSLFTLPLHSTTRSLTQSHSRIHSHSHSHTHTHPHTHPHTLSRTHIHTHTRIKSMFVFRLSQASQSVSRNKSFNIIRDKHQEPFSKTKKGTGWKIFVHFLGLVHLKLSFTIGRTLGLFVVAAAAVAKFIGPLSRVRNLVPKQLDKVVDLRA